jgi:hypothetical protein
MDMKICQKTARVIEICRDTNTGPTQFVNHILMRNIFVIEIL